ncbi:MAG TPA: NifB/NifX family molybdenum-iron cluster-binding protein [Kiritimatiellia bacterium]|nr:NifB/NifX family molybdenum-iron cluster-binding protein [Kiritimatiellia bacterium]
MRICIPVVEYRGLDSPVNGHFGSAPAFALVDSETMSVEPVDNGDHGHVHGMCSPLKALAGSKPDAVIVGGIGRGALLGLRDLGIRVYHGAGSTVAQAVALIKAGKLSEIDENAVCGGHGHGGGCH